MGNKIILNDKYIEYSFEIEMKNEWATGKYIIKKTEYTEEHNIRFDEWLPFKSLKEYNDVKNEIYKAIREYEENS